MLKEIVDRVLRWQFRGIDPDASEEDRVLDAGFDVLNRNGTIGIKELQKELHWGSSRYSELRNYYAKWNMATWENGEVSE